MTSRLQYVAPLLEWYEQLERWNDTDRKYPLDRCLHELIEAQVDRDPNAEAVRFGGESLAYGELNRRSNQCGRYLRGLGTGPDKVVAVLMERSPEMVIALLGILKSGGAYLPLDVDYPRDRLNLILRDAGVSVVVTQKKHEGLLDDFDGAVLCLDDWGDLSGESTANLQNVSRPADLAYVIYTSGSTGKPKGCMISHEAICNRLLWMREEYGIHSRDRILQKTPYTFDVSVWEFFLTMMSGACLVVAKPKGHVDNRYVVDCIRNEQVTVCHFVPSMLRFFLNQANVGSCTSLRHVFVSGEALPFDLVERFRLALPAKLHNLYGPTEAAVDVTFWECEIREDKKVPIGRPIANIRMYVLDSELIPVPIGKTGELYIGGIGLARGYLNNRELTEQRFVPNPFDGGESRLYKTGDAARFLPDGNIEFLGRLDSQVKLRGFRIELGEVEATLDEHEAVDQSIVMVRDEASTDPKLVAYVVVNRGVDTAEIAAFLKGKLPPYMLPNVIAKVPAISVTAHGKADRKALPWPIETNDDAQRNERARGDAAGPAGAEAMPMRSAESIEDRLLACVSDLLGDSKLTAADDLFDVGATSFTIIQIIERIEKEFGVSLTVELFLDDANIRAIAAAVRSVLDETARSSKAAGPAAAKRAPAARDLEPELVRCVAEFLGNTPLEAGDDLFDRGATSFTMIQIIERIEETYGVAVPVDTFLDSPRIDSIAVSLRAALDQKSESDAIA